MTDSYLLLTPFLALGVLALVRFVGCNPVFGLDQTIVAIDGPQLIDVTPGDQSVHLHWIYTEPVKKFTVKYGTAPGGPYPNPVDVTPGANGEHTADINPLTNGTTYYFIIASEPVDDNKGIYPSPEVSGTPGVTSFVTSVASFGGPRNNFQGWVGMAITMGSNDLIVTQLGRIVGPANVQSHEIKIVDVAQGNADIASVTVTMPGGPVGEFTYAGLATPITLKAFRQYFIVSHEVAGGDQWFDLPSVVTTPVATVTAAVFNDDTAPGYMFQGGAGSCYVPVSFRY